MSKLKDKLSANMRAVKAGQAPAAAEPAKPAAKPAASSKPAKPAAAKGRVAGDVPESGTALFPTRIWPD